MAMPKRPLRLSLLLLSVLIVTTACVIPGQSVKPEQESAQEARRQVELAARQQKEREAGRDRQLAQLQLRLLTREAEIVRLNSDVDEVRKRLDDAVLEIVRSKAKMGTLGSRAEAATALAESELLLGALRRESGGAARDLAAAEQMLAIGNKEFQAGNFGGAFYLASSAGATLGIIASRLRTAVPAASDAGAETSFPVPVKFQFTTRGNVRESPRVDSRVLRVADKGQLVVGVANRDLWVLVEFDDGARGWTFHDLLGPR